MRLMTISEMTAVSGARPPDMSVGDSVALGSAVGAGWGVGLAQAGGFGLVETGVAGGVMGIVGAGVVGAAIGGYLVGTTIENAMDGDEGYPWP